MYAGARGYDADVYVFDVQTARSHDVLDVLDTAQWEFYVISREQVAATCYRSLSLATVAGISGESVSLDRLDVAVRAGLVD